MIHFDLFIVIVPTTPGPCGAGQTTCRNGQCIPLDYRCDGDTDCDNNSDEESCSGKYMYEFAIHFSTFLGKFTFNKRKLL